MDFKTFSREFMNINGWELDSEGRYMIFRKPLSVWDSEKDQDTKFTSLKEMWDYCYDGEHKVSDALADVDEFVFWLDE